MSDRTAPTAHPIAPIFAARWSPRAYADKPVPPELLRSVLEAARWAASCQNEQPWNYLVTRRHVEPDAFAKLHACLSSGNQPWVAVAPVLMLAVARTTYAAKGTPNAHARYDQGQASANLVAQAGSLGLQCRQMAGFDPAKAREAFAIPEGYDPIACIAMGFPVPAAEAPEALREREMAPRKRNPIESFVHLGAWETLGAP